MKNTYLVRLSYYTRTYKTLSSDLLRRYEL